jgi:LacI family transcriptional regulator
MDCRRAQLPTRRPRPFPSTRANPRDGPHRPDAANPFFAEVAQAIERAAAPHGLAVLVGTTADDPAKEAKYLEDLAERRVDGILISSRSDQDLSPATTLAVPTVLMDRAPDNMPISTIAFDNVGGAATVTRHLKDHANRTVHLVAGPQDAAVSGRRIAGWRAALQDAGLPTLRTTHSPFRYEGGRTAAARRLFSRRQPPTGSPARCSALRWWGASSWAVQ